MNPMTISFLKHTWNEGIYLFSLRYVTGYDQYKIWVEIWIVVADWSLFAIDYEILDWVRLKLKAFLRLLGVLF
jgi:hypothetical protein